MASNSRLATVKQEIPSTSSPFPPQQSTGVIDICSDSDSDREIAQTRPDKRARVSNDEQNSGKRKKPADALPVGFLQPLPRDKDPNPLPLVTTSNPIAPEKDPNPITPLQQGSKQFWKAGDYEGSPEISAQSNGLDHVRVHPKFLHSNATSHKWALGALAELLDNSLDEVANGATFVNIDMLENKKDGSRMLLVEDNGGGMDPDKMRQCISLGYSAKSKIPSTIGQYGNGFKTSTMRLGADVIVFSRSSAKNGKRSTQSIGMLSYTFLRSTGKEDIVVPMLDYEKENNWRKLARTNLQDWNTNLETILRWSPYSTESDLLEQFNSIKDQGTRIIIYNLWEDDQGELELDFDSDPHDIQIRGVNRDTKNIQKAIEFPNSKHFLTYRHSLRSYASILYLRLPHVFQMILRGEIIEHHNIVNDMMLKQDVTYRPQSIDKDQNATTFTPKDPSMVVSVTIGFVKDAKHHIDVQGFNVYHKNRLIKPFWRVWTAAGSGGRGVIGVLEANFIEPAHDKQDFERTTMLSKLEARLVQMQKNYWTNNSHRIGYCGGYQNRKNKDIDNDYTEIGSPSTSLPAPSGNTWKSIPGFSNPPTQKPGNSKLNSKTTNQDNNNNNNNNSTDSSDDSDPEYNSGNKLSKLRSLKPSPFPIQRLKNRDLVSRVSVSRFLTPVRLGGGVETNGIGTRSQTKESKGKSKENGSAHDETETVEKLKAENDALKAENEILQEKVTGTELKLTQELQIEKDKNKNLSEQLEEKQRQLEETNKEQDALIEIFHEERNRRDKDEQNLRKKLKDASDTINDLVKKLREAGKN